MESKKIKSIISFLIISFLVVIIITLLANNISNRSASSYKPVDKNISIVTKIETTSYTLAQVKAHSSASNCWTVVKNNVYDLTAWITQHPGGSEAIISTCGKDATIAFLGQHGGQQNPENVLNSFKIGSYTK
ncbi:MAG: cytochrome b5-like heme/steroid binding domain-containing protein [Candidatus Paceibacterota bacterium]